jgi:lipopolysaccharide transport protein LptA
MMRAVLACLALALGVAVGLPAAAAVSPETDTASIAIAVVPFETNAPPGADVPDVGMLLADRIGTQGVQKVVGPGEFAVEADAEPGDEAVQAWAKQAAVAVVVVGRVTRIGNQMSVDVRLRSGETGEVVGTYVAEILDAERLEATVDRLASQILDGAGEFIQASAPAVSSASPAAPSPGGDAPFGILFDSGSPISIRSDELEAVKSNGFRRLLFTQNVVVTQDDVTIRSNRLEAFYPPNTSQPDRMVASGRVRMSQGDNEARCDKATYERAKDLLVCRGNAELREGSDCVAGEWIEFDLAAETVTVRGGARVVIGGENGDAAASGGGCL